MRSNGELVDHLVRSGVLRTPRLIHAFERVDRAEFVPDEHKGASYLDGPLPLRRGATISQPTVVAFMLELLEPRMTDLILDVGAGSGYTTALLAAIAPNTHAVEIEPALVEYANERLERHGIDVTLARGLGLPELAPFDRILVSAAAQRLPDELLAQLSEGGIMVIPIGTEIWKVTKQTPESIIERYPGFAFVPLRATSA